MAGDKSDFAKCMSTLAVSIHHQPGFDSIKVDNGFRSRGLALAIRRSMGRGQG